MLLLLSVYSDFWLLLILRYLVAVFVYPVGETSQSLRFTSLSTVFCHPSGFKWKKDGEMELWNSGSKCRMKWDRFRMKRNEWWRNGWRMLERRGILPYTLSISGLAFFYSFIFHFFISCHLIYYFFIFILSVSELFLLSTFSTFYFLSSFYHFFCNLLFDSYQLYYKSKGLEWKGQAWMGHINCFSFTPSFYYTLEFHLSHIFHFDFSRSRMN